MISAAYLIFSGNSGTDYEEVLWVLARLPPPLLRALSSPQVLLPARRQVPRPSAPPEESLERISLIEQYCSDLYR